MLKTVECENFIEQKVEFYEGLNTILGDDQSTNSIGKSTFLMIVDFLFGGSSFLEKDSGSLKELGSLTFKYSFSFGGELYFYIRRTNDPNTIYTCSSDFNVISEISLDKFTESLKVFYDLEIDSTFRAAVNPYSRIWGKDNYNVDKPIANHPKEAESFSIENLIKLFGLYNDISKTLIEIKSEEESKKILNGMYKKDLIPKVTKKEFIENELKVASLKDELQRIQDSFLLFTLNADELTNKDLIDLKVKKQRLLDAQLSVQTKIKRLELNLEKTSIKSKYFVKLSDFFENINQEKILEIENFHNKMSKILKRELETSKAILEEENQELRSRINEINYKIDSLLENVESPKAIIEKVFDLTIEINRISEANRYFQQKENAKENVRSLNISLEEVINSILKNIEIKVNDELNRLNKLIHTEKKKVPSIKLNRKSYKFDHSTNTGTGKSFSDLIEFDLAIFNLTNLPILIHDSILFKNVENKTVERVLEQYSNFSKQIFISLDGINKFKKSSQGILKEKCVLQLTESRKLFNRDWR